MGEPSRAEQPGDPEEPSGGEPPEVDDLEELVELIERQRGPVYVRVSDGPADDAGRVSRDYESGLELPGLSASRASPPQWWTRPATDWVARQICAYVHLAREDPGRVAWICTGRLVGRGPDHEPLLADVRPLAVLTRRCVAAAERCYEERFDVGRDST